MKSRPATHRERAVARVFAILTNGGREVVTATTNSGKTYTVGPWTPAGEPHDRFVIYGYGRDSVPAYENLSAAWAADGFVGLVSDGNARDAAIEADRKAGRKPATTILSPLKFGTRVIAVYDEQTPRRNPGHVASRTQIRALVRFATWHGPHWKATLRRAWETDAYGYADASIVGPIQSLRNAESFGMQGLDA